jgi:hypothetical protein
LYLLATIEGIKHVLCQDFIGWVLKFWLGLEMLAD